MKNLLLNKIGGLNLMGVRLRFLFVAIIFLLFLGCAAQGDKHLKDSAQRELITDQTEPSSGVKSVKVVDQSGEHIYKTSNLEDKNLAIFDESENEKNNNSQIDESTIKSEKNRIVHGELKEGSRYSARGLQSPKKIERRAKPSSSGSKILKSEETVKVELAFDNADLFEVLDATLFELFKVNYIIDPQVKTKLSFHFSGNYTKDQFIELLNDVLQLSNLSITKGPGDMFKIVKKNESAGFSSQDVYEYGLPDASGDVSRLVRLKYLDASSVLKSIQTFTSRGAAVSIDTMNNSVIVTDTLENVEKVINVLAIMDVPYFMDISWRIFPVKEIEAKDIVQNITKLIKSAGLYYRPGAVKGGYEILSIDSINAILVATRWPEILELVDKWISAMDYLGDD
ncbi:MAG: hypothetical protein HQK64_06675, partial [Desulfamplus sp.]|nr:hypothetical protein [Desulfamplus sp.]